MTSKGHSMMPLYIFDSTITAALKRVPRGGPYLLKLARLVVK